MDVSVKKIPKRKDDRIVLQFDYDCFYAQVMENKNPSLKSKPLGIKQKNILATCNYIARGRGVRKLMLITEAKKMCPDLVLVEGEDLTCFRDTSKVLFAFLRSHSWNGKAEKLGFDEVFLDVTDIIDYNVSCLNQAALTSSFFHLSKKDPEHGFACDLSSIAGCVVGELPVPLKLDDDYTYLRLLLASHLAMYLRQKLETDFGYTSTCGIATNKLLSKLAGATNKPRNQTTLLSISDQQVAVFMDKYKLRQLPGLGFKTAQLIEAHVTKEAEAEAEALREIDTITTSHTFESVVTVGEARLHPDITAGFLERLLVGPGAEKGLGARVWGLLHGVDVSEVKLASDIPTQISIEDTYKGLETLPEITQELFKLSCSLVRRMRVDLLGPSLDTDEQQQQDEQRWIARPKTLRLSIRWWSSTGARFGQDFSRISRSAPLPSFVFDAEANMEDIADKLVAESLLPLLRKLQADQGGRSWNLQLINICVANMIAGAADDKNGAGRDISVMFKRQDEVLRPWRVTEMPQLGTGDETGQSVQDLFDDLDSEAADWGDTKGEACPFCGHDIPAFAVAAHARYHEPDDDEF